MRRVKTNVANESKRDDEHMEVDFGNGCGNQPTKFVMSEKELQTHSTSDVLPRRSGRTQDVQTFGKRTKQNVCVHTSENAERRAHREHMKGKCRVVAWLKVGLAITIKEKYSGDDARTCYVENS